MFDTLLMVVPWSSTAI